MVIGAKRAAWPAAQQNAIGQKSATPASSSQARARMRQLKLG